MSSFTQVFSHVCHVTLYNVFVCSYIYSVCLSSMSVLLISDLHTNTPLEPEQSFSGRVPSLVSVGLQLMDHHRLKSRELLWIQLVLLGQFLQRERYIHLCVCLSIQYSWVHNTLPQHNSTILLHCTKKTEKMDSICMMQHVICSACIMNLTKGYSWSVRDALHIHTYVPQYFH